MSIQGWQNLASRQQRIIGREHVLVEIQRIYPKAFEVEVADDLAYLVGSKAHSTLVAVAVRTTGSDFTWAVTMMPSVSYQAGIRSTLVRADGRSRIVPGQNAPRGIVYEGARTVETAKRNFYKRRIYKDRSGQWFVWIENTVKARELGPFETKADAEAARLI